MTPELAMAAAFVAGFFGSTHCVGMCGAIVILFEAPTGNRQTSNAWVRRMLYNLGRLLFYVLLGGVAAVGGAVLTNTVGVSQGLVLLRVLASALVIAIGLNLLFDWRMTRFLDSAGAGLWQKLSRLAKYTLPADTPARSFSSGILWGALPCGLVYSAVAVAATSGSFVSGTAVMTAFWFGTLPALLAVGASAQQLQRWKRHRTLRRFAGIVVILVGLAALIPLGTQENGQHHHPRTSTLLQEGK